MECWSVGIEASSDIGRKVKRANSTNQEQSQTNSINQPKTANSDISRQVNSKKEKKRHSKFNKRGSPMSLGQRRDMYSCSRAWSIGSDEMAS